LNGYLGIKKKAEKKETTAEIGSRTAKGGYNNEKYFRELLNYNLNTKEAQDILKQLNIDFKKIKSLKVKKIGGKLKPDNQIFIVFKDNTSQTMNISNKKQDSTGFNHIDRRTVDDYATKFDLKPITRDALKKYCGVSPFSPLDLLNKGELSKSEYQKLVDIPEKKAHKEKESQGGRFYLNELSQEERDSVLNEFELKKKQIMHFILNGDNSEYPVDYVVGTKLLKEKNRIDHLVFPLEEIINMACENNFILSKVRKNFGSNLKIGSITVQKKGGTGRSTNLQFKWTDLFPKDKKLRFNYNK